MPEVLVLDPQSIENLRALNPDDDDEFLREITGIFIEDTPQRIAELDQSLLAGDLPVFARAAHSIKGSSSNIGAMALRAAAERLEHRARADGLANVGPQLAELKTEFERAHAALTSLLGK